MKKTTAKTKATKAEATKAEETVGQTTPVQESAQGAADAKQEQKQPQVALFGQIGFETVANFDEYIARMKQNNYNDILLTVNMALRSVSQRGGFSLEENEAVSVALRHLNGAFSVAEPAEETK